MKIFAVFSFLLILLALVQTAFLPIPLGLIALVTWFLLRGTKYLVLFTIFFSLALAIVAVIPAWVVFAASCLSLYLFIGSKSFLPSRNLVHIILAVTSLVAWEVSIVGLTRLFNL
ncbi:MAG TPA: hypothetical protein VF303_02180 [Candidatus Nanoarchaeia archaeon]